MAEVARALPQTLAAGAFHRKTRTVLAAISIDAVRPNEAQPRRHFDETALSELAASIRQRGILQPVIVKRHGDGFLIMAGERRYRAAKLAGMNVIPAIVRDDDPLEIAIIENLQREDLSPLEEAEGLGALIDKYGYTHEALADLVGKSRPHISNTLAMRRLPERIKREYLDRPDVSREILISVARAESPERQDLLWRLAKLRRLSVQRFRSEQAGRPGAPDEIAELARLVRRLGRKLRALDKGALPALQTARVQRILSRAQRRIERSLAALAVTSEQEDGASTADRTAS
jgi:ParB family transcriptional regulator, chromosome partitioning protein